MVTTLIEHPVQHPLRPSFFFWITVAMAFFVFGGFGLTYWQPMATGRLAPLPPIVHLHGLFFFSWIVLLVIQSSLINTKRVSLHRSLGTFGIAVATGVLITGTLITLMFGHATPTDVTNYHDLMYLGFMAVIGFGLLFTLAIRRTRDPDSHRRLILLATIPLLPPGINRLYMVPFGLAELPLLTTYLTMDAIAAAILLHDWRATGRLKGASMIGAAVILTQQLLHAPIVKSDAFAGLVRILTDLVYYR